MYSPRLQHNRSQIVNSDVILINKIDLIEEESLAYVKEKVGELAPTSTIYPTKYSQIPLPFIFDIEDKANLTQGVSHDRSHVMYQISAKGTNHPILRCLPYLGKGHRKEKTLAQPQKHTKGHVHEHSFNNVVVESTSPVVLWKFQEFLKLLDARVVRVKGISVIPVY
jgi:G3E family GTPase